MPPPLRAEADPSRPLGHARIVLRGVAEGADLRFGLMREGYPAAHLGPRGWQLGEAVLEPAAVESEGGAPVIILGPALVRHIEPGPLTLRLPALGRDLPLFWPADIPVYDAGDDTRALAVAGRSAADTARGPAATAPPPGGDDATVMPSSLPPPPPVQPPAPRRRVPLVPAALAAVVVAGAAGAALWWLSGDEPAPLASLPAATPAPPPLPPWPEGTDGLSLPEVVARAPSAEGILAVALRRQAAGRHDDALVLFEEAADRGVAAAYTALGRLYDPNGFQPGRPFTAPDLRQAALYYRRAAEAGDTQVLPLREALRTYLKAAAAAGNATAAEALAEFWP